MKFYPYRFKISNEGKQPMKLPSIISTEKSPMRLAMEAGCETFQEIDDFVKTHGGGNSNSAMENIVSGYIAPAQMSLRALETMCRDILQDLDDGPVYFKDGEGNLIPLSTVEFLPDGGFALRNDTNPDTPPTVTTFSEKECSFETQRQSQGER